MGRFESLPFDDQMGRTGTPFSWMAFHETANRYFGAAMFD
jgi:hypothetical protein